MAEVMYQGHGSLRFTSREGKVIYLDPYVGEGYDLPADLILVTHGHGDHDQVQLVSRRREDCVLFTHAEAIGPEGYETLDLGWVRVVPVKAQNRNHDPAKCVGYLLFLDGITVWAAGDTSYYEEMKDLADLAVDWAFLPTDGKYNMGPGEAARCAEAAGVKKAVPIHTAPGVLYDPAVAERFPFAGRVLLAAGETMEL